VPRQISFSAPLAAPADTAYTAMVDAGYLRARLRDLGGPGAALLEHQADADGARYRLRHGLDSAALPPIAQRLVSGGDLVIERTETVRRAGPGNYTGTVAVQVLGAPVTASGASSLQDAAGGATFAVNASVTVRIPFFGGAIEPVIAEQVQQLLAAETTFTAEWLRDH
jgi:hypothetical protein